MSIEATTEAEAIIQAARLGAEPCTLDLGGYHVVPTADGNVKAFDLTGDQYRDQPSRKTGTVTVTDVPSFLAFYSKHATSPPRPGCRLARSAVSAAAGSPPAATPTACPGAAATHPPRQEHHRDP